MKNSIFKKRNANFLLFAFSLVSLVYPELFGLIGIKIEAARASLISAASFLIACAVELFVLKSDVNTAIEEFLGTSINARREMMEDLETFSKKTEVTKIRSSVVFREINSAIFDAVEVKRTDLGSYSSHSDVISSKWLSIYNKWLPGRREGEWTDIVGPSQLFAGPFQHIARPKEFGGTHKIVILRHSTPIMNFIILTSGDGVSTVYFGWVTGSLGESVFKSNERKTVDLFENYFKRLEDHRTWGNPVEVDYQHESVMRRYGRGDLVDKLGNWLTLCVRDGSVATFGLFEIKLSKGKRPYSRAGYLEFEGNVFESDLRYRGAITHGEGEVAHYTDKAFIEYLDLTRKKAGYCFYEFSNPSCGFEVESDEVRGFFIDHGDDVRSQIYGFKSNEFEGVQYLSNEDRRDELKRAAKYTLDVLCNKGLITSKQRDDALLVLASTRK